MILDMLADWLQKWGRAAMIPRSNWGDSPPIPLAAYDPAKHGGPYLKRYYLFRSRWLGVFIHQFYRADPEGLHDHPWAFFTYILRGGYTEQVIGVVDEDHHTRRAGDWAVRAAGEFHRIRGLLSAPGGTWTLFVHGPRRRTWGFLPMGVEEFWRPVLRRA